MFFKGFPVLTDTQIRNAKATDKPVKLSDGKGLFVEIRPNGSELWRYRYEIGGKENLFAVGIPYARISQDRTGVPNKPRHRVDGVVLEVSVTKTGR